ncbi:Glutathione synthetase, partial [Operophtera brumata]
MSQARLASCIPLPLEPKALISVIEKAKDWALMHGVGMRDRKNFTKDAIQPVSLGMLRSDIMLESRCPHTVNKCAKHTPYCSWKQVEINSIASGFGHLGPSLSLGLFRSDYLMQQPEGNALKQVEFNTMPENRALSGLCAGITDAYDLFGVPGAVVLFVVEEVSYNICDQRAIKCPSIQYQLAGTKKVQQALAGPGALERFMGPTAAAGRVRDIFTGLYSLDFDQSGEQAREGGGNNLYGSDVREALLRMRHSRERAAYILMERILPPL